MASLDPNNGGDDPGDGDPPRTPRLVPIDDAKPLTPDTEENVAEQTDGVFRNFVYRMYNNERCEQEADDTPNAPELTTFTDEPLGISSQVGRQLAMIGDDINDRYSSQFTHLIKMLNIRPDTAYEAFAGVAKKLFRDGNISWGRVITLLCFGYRMAVTVLERGIHGFFSKIVGFVCRFIMVEKIAQWIAEQGGWRAVLNYVPETIGWPTIGLIMSFAVASVLAALFLSRKGS